jgi:hypothetical protein
MFFKRMYCMYTCQIIGDRQKQVIKDGTLVFQSVIKKIISLSSNAQLVHDQRG